VNWIDVLKLDQVSIGSTTLDTRELPEENDICCQEAKMKYNKVQKPPKYVPYEYVTMADKLDCDEFKVWLKRTLSHRKDGWIKRIVDEWEACENE
tara:strand:- start:2130 stop:2414 length:285 start_codon:yes stop_codon:yes gene_type:complete